jgi:DNA gyrase/topoisomerase IV subunit B
LNSNSAQSKIIYQRIIAAAKGRMAANRAKNAKKKEAGGIINGLSALSKVTLASGDDPKNKRMFIVEGKNCLLKNFLIAE